MPATKSIASELAIGLHADLTEALSRNARLAMAIDMAPTTFIDVALVATSATFLALAQGLTSGGRLTRAQWMAYQEAIQTKVRQQIESILADQG